MYNKTLFKHFREKYVESLKKFSEEAKTNPEHAIRWTADEVVELQYVSEAIDEIEDILDTSKDFTRNINLLVMDYVRKLTEGGIGTRSTCAFTNAIFMHEAVAQKTILSMLKSIQSDYERKVVA